MEDNRQKPGFFVRLATLIVDKRNLFFLLYTAGIIFSLISQGWVQVNNDITDYLPEETETRQGLPADGRRVYHLWHSPGHGLQYYI